MPLFSGGPQLPQGMFFKALGCIAKVSGNKAEVKTLCESNHSQLPTLDNSTETATNKMHNLFDTCKFYCIIIFTESQSSIFAVISGTPNDLYVDAEYDTTSQSYKQARGQPDITVPSTAWKSGQPGSGPKHCVVMKASENFKLDDKDCTENKGGFCYTPFKPGFTFN